MNNTKAARPVQTLWHGNVKVSIWANQTQNGEMYSATYARIYTDKTGKLREAYSFSGIENLRVRALADQADFVINSLQQEFNRKNRAQEPPQAPQQAELPAVNDEQAASHAQQTSPQATTQSQASSPYSQYNHTG